MGCRVGSCGTWVMCESGYEQWCTRRRNPVGPTVPDAEGNPTTGDTAVSRCEDFALHIPSELTVACAPPALVSPPASPLKHYNVGPGARAILAWEPRPRAQIAKAMGADVSVISHGRSKWCRRTPLRC